jgi:hypothetical protein
MRPSASYLARVVEIGSSVDQTEYPDVQTRELAYGGVA